MLAPLRFLDATHIQMGRERLVYFAGTNYLGLSWHPAVRAAMARAAAGGMLQPGASRRTTGEQAAYRHLETRLARFFRFGACAVVPSGYLAPVAAAQGLRDVITHVLLTQEAHAAVADAARLTGCPVTLFPGGDLPALRRLLRKLPRNAVPLLACDGTFSNRGGVAPLREYLNALPARGFLLIDDAHGAGTVGPGGRGALALLGLQGASDSRVIQTVSLAKALGVAGGAVLGATPVVAALRQLAAGYIGSTPLLLPAVAALEVSLELVQRHSGRSGPNPPGKLQEHARFFHELLTEGLNLAAQGVVRPVGVSSRAGGLTPLLAVRVLSDPRTPVTGVYPGSAGARTSFARVLREHGIFPPYITYLGGPAGGYFRFALSSRHTLAEIRLLARAIRAGVAAGMETARQLGE